MGVQEQPQWSRSGFTFLKKMREETTCCRIESQGCMTAIFFKRKNDQGSGLFWSWRSWVAATEKVPSALLLNPDPGISKRNCFVDLSTLVGPSPLTFHWTRNGADLVLSVLATCPRDAFFFF